VKLNGTIFLSNFFAEKTCKTENVFHSQSWLHASYFRGKNGQKKTCLRPVSRLRVSVVLNNRKCVLLSSFKGLCLIANCP